MLSFSEALKGVIESGLGDVKAGAAGGGSGSGLSGVLKRGGDRMPLPGEVGERGGPKKDVRLDAEAGSLGVGGVGRSARLAVMGVGNFGCMAALWKGMVTDTLVPCPGPADDMTICPLLSLTNRAVTASPSPISVFLVLRNLASFVSVVESSAASSSSRIFSKSRNILSSCDSKRPIP